MKQLPLHQKLSAIVTTCNARRKLTRLLLADDKPGGIFAKIPGYGMGKGKADDTEGTMLRDRCKVALRKTEKGDLVRSTATVNSAHHLPKLRESTTGLERIPSA